MSTTLTSNRSTTEVTMTRTMCVLAALTATLFMSNTLAHTTDDMRKLITDKSVNYNKQFRPVYNQSEKLWLLVNFELVTIQEFDEVTEKFSVVGFLVMYWNDQFLKWDPADYNNMTEFTAEGGDFWHPNMVLLNPYDKIEAVGEDWDVFKYDNNGNVLVYPGSVFDSTCSVDVTHYPWDEQHCSLLFSAWGYSSYDIGLIPIGDRFGTAYFSKNGAWDLTDASTETFDNGDGSAIVSFNLRLRRKPRFVVVNVILPIMFMSVLNMVVFLIPTESGERISYCLTVLLAIAVFLTLVGDNLPKTSNPMSILSYYLLGVLVISVSIILGTVFSLRLYFRDESNPVPNCIAAFVRCFSCRCKRKPKSDNKQRSHKERRTHSDRAARDEDGRDGSGRNGGVFMTNGFPAMTRDYTDNWRRQRGVKSYSHASSKYMYHEEGGSRRSDVTLNDVDDEDKVTWKDVSCTVDIVLFLFFVLSLTVTTAVFFSMILNKENVPGNE